MWFGRYTQKTHSLAYLQATCFARFLILIIFIRASLVKANNSQKCFIFYELEICSTDSFLCQRIWVHPPVIRWWMYNFWIKNSNTRMQMFRCTAQTKFIISHLNIALSTLTVQYFLHDKFRGIFVVVVVVVKWNAKAISNKNPEATEITHNREIVRCLRKWSKENAVKIYSKNVSAFHNNVDTYASHVSWTKVDVTYASQIDRILNWICMEEMCTALPST